MKTANNLWSNVFRLKKCVFKHNELINFSEYVLIQYLDLEPEAHRPKYKVMKINSLCAFQVLSDVLYDMTLAWLGLLDGQPSKAQLSYATAYHGEN